MRTLVRLAVEGCLAVGIVMLAVALRVALEGVTRSQVRRSSGWNAA
jgi:hypothetical protein